MSYNKFRYEKDSMGEVAVEESHFWGAQTERSRKNFKIGTEVVPREIIQALLHIKWCAADANLKLGVLDSKRANAIKEAVDKIFSEELYDHFPLVIWQTGSGTQTNMNVNEVIAYLANQSVDKASYLHPNDHVNLSQSSNDTFPTAMHVAVALQIKLFLLPAIEKMHVLFQEKSNEFARYIKIARTHLQDAVPMTLGQEFGAFSAQLLLAYKRIESSLPRLSAIAQGATAVGTGINSPKEFSSLFCKVLTERVVFDFHSPISFFEALSTHDTLVEISGQLNVLATTLMKIANDIRWLGSGPRCGLSEIYLPENEPGSSIMPGKVNPTQAEALSMVCCQVMGNHVTISIAGSNGHFQLNTFKPVIAFNVLQSIKLLNDAIISFTENCLRGITVNENQLNENVNKSLMLVTALNPIIGYEKSANIAKHALKNNVTLKKATIDLGYMSEDQFNNIMDLYAMVGDRKG